MSAVTVARPPRRWRGLQRVLAVRLDNLGDVLMTTPALAAIRHGLPDARLDLLASPAGAALAPHLPMVDAVIAAEAAWVKVGADSDAPQVATQRLVERLADGGYDAAVIFTVCTQSALPAAMACLLAGIPRRLAHCRENPYALLTDWVRDDETVADGMRHEVERQLALVHSVGLATPDARLRFALRPQDRAAARARLQAAGLAPDEPYVVVHPGASAASRRWPAARFGLAAAAVARASGRRIVYSGDAGEATLVEQARAAQQTAGAPASVSLAGALALGELGALIDGADLLLANNTGPVHLAAALGTPVVDLYALTNPQHTPWQVPSLVLSQDVPCRHCLSSVCRSGHHLCLLGVAPEQVAQAALELLHAHRNAAVPAAVAA